MNKRSMRCSTGYVATANEWRKRNGCIPASATAVRSASYRADQIGARQKFLVHQTNHPTQIGPDLPALRGPGFLPGFVSGGEDFTDLRGLQPEQKVFPKLLIHHGRISSEKSGEPRPLGERSPLNGLLTGPCGRELRS